GKDLDEEIARTLFHGLVQADVPYTAPPWHPGVGQRLRDPEWLLRPGGSGTCIDFALLYAAALLRPELRPHLVLLRAGDHGHAGVAIRVGPWPGQATPLWAAGVGVGVLEVVDPAGASQDENWIFVDVTVAASNEPTDGDRFTLARTRMSDLLRGEGANRFKHIHLVDVAARQRSDDKPWPAPTWRGAVRSWLPTPRRPWMQFPDRETLVHDVLNAESPVVITGTQGVGKSRLALEAARRFDGGFGWMVTATNERSLDASFARNERVERGRPLDVDSVDLVARAVDARKRLSETADAWVLIVDNLMFDDKQPRPRWVDRIPAPGERQKLIVTTTLPASCFPANWHVIRVERLASEGVPDDRLRGVVAGTPLLLEAFGALLVAAPDVYDASWATVDCDAATGARSYWSALAPTLSVEQRAVAQLLAFMPPDDVGSDALTACVRGAAAAVEVFAQVGLLTATGDGHVMHRLFGAAIRDSLGDQCDEVVRRLLSFEPLRTHLLSRADEEVVRELASALDKSDDGLAFWALAGIQEVYQPKQSLPTFSRALELLDSSKDEHRNAYADCLHAHGRDVNQNWTSRSIDQIEFAIGQMEEAMRIRPASEKAGQIKHRALHSLLRQRRANKLPDKDPERIAELLEVKKLLDRGWRQQTKACPPGDPLIDRALYNRAGVRVDLAQQVPTRSKALLREADEIYDECVRFRRHFYGSPNPLTATAVNGAGLAAYYVGLLNPDVDGVAAVEQAERYVVDALEMRQQLATDGDIVKSCELLAKVVILRAKLAGGDVGTAVSAICRELGEHAPTTRAAPAG
ncbi:MAG: hypothetical protein JO222_13500, partial [Frankiales bacterium]|nr:hypothetical protein [Frankiales bacterium]